jgi:predicted acetyltransferase
MIAEFFVLRKYRHCGVGRAAAFAVFDRFPGHWEVSQIAENSPAQQFWRRIIAQYTHGRYQEVLLDNETWHGPVQIFDNPSALDYSAR